MRFDWQFEEPMALRGLVVVASLTDPGSAIRSSYISDLSLSFRNALENVKLAFVDATALLKSYLIQKSATLPPRYWEM